MRTRVNTRKEEAVVWLWKMYRKVISEAKGTDEDGEAERDDRR